MLNFRNRQVLSVVTSALEWYQINICIALASVLSKVFFTNSSSWLLAIFWLAIASGRVVGAYFFGWYSDRYNRVSAVSLSFVLMMCATCTIALLPTGLAIPFIFLTFLQGVALGGNHNIAVMDAQTTRGRKYYFSCMSFVGVLCGFVFGSMVVSFANMFFKQEIALIGWRYVLLTSLIGLVLIAPLKEYAKEFVEHKAMQVKVRVNKLFVVVVFLLAQIHMFYTYIFFVFLPNYKVMFIQRESLTQVWMNSLAMFALMLATIFFFANLADKYGALKLTIIANCILLADCCLHALLPWQGSSLIYIVLYGIPLSIISSSFYGYITTVFHKTNRGRISSMIVNINAAITAISIPFMKKLADYNFDYLIATYGFLSLSAIFIMLFMKEKWAYEHD